MRYCLLLLLLSGPFLTGNAQKSKVNSLSSKNNGTLLFHSGFEQGSAVVHLSNSPSTDDDIIGKDLSVSAPNDWVQDIDKSRNLGNFNLQYEGGDSSIRFARIVPEPGNPRNRVLHFWAAQPNAGKGGKTRIQANIYAGKNKQMEGIKEFYQSVRLFLPEDMNAVKSYPDKIEWLTIMEVWNNIQWADDPYPFRITVGMGKPSAEKSELHFMVDAEDYEYATANSRGQYIKLWRDMNTAVDIPTGKWFTLEYYIREGEGQDGRFYMLMTPDGGKRQVIFDIHNFTHNSKDPRPDGITLWNPMKLYTSRQLTEYVRSQGKALQIYWDDLSIWKNRQP